MEYIVQYKSMMDFWFDLRTFDTEQTAKDYMSAKAYIFGDHVSLRVVEKFDEEYLIVENASGKMPKYAA